MLVIVFYVFLYFPTSINTNILKNCAKQHFKEHILSQFFRIQISVFRFLFLYENHFATTRFLSNTAVCRQFHYTDTVFIWCCFFT